jgi:hypothetical protein
MLEPAIRTPNFYPLGIIFYLLVHDLSNLDLRFRPHT